MRLALSSFYSIAYSVYGAAQIEREFQQPVENGLSDEKEPVKTEFFESDPFAPRKAEFLFSLETEYRFEKGDEVVIDSNGSPTKIRVMNVQVRVADGSLSREILALKI